MVSIVALGDSTTAGTPGFFSPREKRPDGEGDIESQYAYWVQLLKPHWKVHNRGVRGSRTDQILRRFDWDVPPLSPDLVIVLGGANDIHQNKDLETSQGHLTQLYEKCKSFSSRVLACSVLPLDIFTPEQKQSILDLNKWVERTAQGLGLGFCDTYQALEDPSRPGFLRATPDDIHPDVSGYRLMGETITDAILKLWPELG